MRIKDEFLSQMRNQSVMTLKLFQMMSLVVKFLENFHTMRLTKDNQITSASTSQSSRLMQTSKRASMRNQDGGRALRWDSSVVVWQRLILKTIPEALTSFLED